MTHTLLSNRKMPCCGYEVRLDYQDKTGPIFWNPFSEVVQCHNCGQVFDKRPSVASAMPREHRMAVIMQEMVRELNSLYQDDNRYYDHITATPLIRRANECIREVIPGMFLL